MSFSGKPEIAPNLIWRMLDDNTVVVSPAEGQVRVLNHTGTLVWQLLSEGCSLPEIEAQLVHEFGILPEQAHLDLTAFLDDLTKNRLVVWSD